MRMMIGLWNVEKSVGLLSLGRKRLGLKGSYGGWRDDSANSWAAAVCAQMAELWDVFVEQHLCILWG